MSALALKAQDNKIVVLEDIKMDAPRTKDFAAIINALRGDSRKTLLVLNENNENVYLSSRNLENNKTVILSDLNTYDIMNAGTVIISESAAQLFSEEEIIPLEETATQNETATTEEQA
jgi:large subunit ribosomal protein L4